MTDIKKQQSHVLLKRSLYSTSRIANTRRRRRHSPCEVKYCTHNDKSARDRRLAPHRRRIANLLSVVALIVYLHGVNADY